MKNATPTSIDQLYPKTYLCGHVMISSNGELFEIVVTQPETEDAFVAVNVTKSEKDAFLVKLRANWNCPCVLLEDAKNPRLIFMLIDAVLPIQ